ncbi:DEAD/DEAH box helicase [Saccharomonospora sp. NPDC046836]|uniref:DEAD/DEAH box helicase n=1 Tax=Saccharomonospora sp. NPDC046836 TaxID=3156921 RepID=UPI0033D78ED5
MEHVGPSFRGLFVGVDSYLSDEMRQLRAAAWDVRKAHALFEDNFDGGAFTLLVDEKVTRPRLIKELELLRATSSPDDVVMIMFSGHGSSTHDLIVHDTDMADLAGTALPLAELFDHLRSLPVRHVVVLLDCCFAGGAGAKAVWSGTATGPLEVPSAPGAALHLLTACGEDEGAYEDPQLGHGVFTGQLLRALTGEAETTNEDKIPLRALFESVRRHVASRAALLERSQHPVVDTSSREDLMWPVMEAGPAYRALAGPHAPRLATTELSSLREHGFTDAVLDLWRHHIGSLNDLQCTAVNKSGILRGNSVLVVAPTASGKTMVGEMAAVRSALRRGRSVFLVPTRALVNELYTRFAGMYGPLGIQVVRATGELSADVPAIVNGRYTLAVLTYETYAGLVQAHPELLRDVKTMVVDEVQTIGDTERGAALELFLTSVMSRPEAGRPQIIALSSGLGDDYSHLDTWLELGVLRWSARQVSLVEGTLTPDGTFRHRDENGTESSDQLLMRPKYDADFDTVLELVRLEVRQGRQVIVFRRSREASMSDAKWFSRLELPAAARVLDALPREDHTRVRTALAACLRHGVAFHTGDLSDAARRVVERAFREPNSEIKVLVCTTSLAQGVNFPADVVVVRDLGDPSGGEPWDCSVSKYKNMVGRAGRTSLGRAVMPVHAGDPYNVFDHFVRGVPGKVRSSLLDEPDRDSLVLRALALLRARNPLRVWSPDVYKFLNHSLAAHQRRGDGAQFELTPQDVFRTADALSAVGLVDRTGQDLRLTSLGAVLSGGTLGVRSALEVVRLLRELDPAAVTDELLLVLAQSTAEMDAVAIDRNSRWRDTMTYFSRQGFPEVVTSTVLNASNGFERAARALICLKWVRLVAMTEIEGRLAATGARQIVPINPVLSRTRDVIDSVVQLALEVHPSIDRADLVQLPLQLDRGVPAAFTELVVRAGHAVDRWDYQCLWRHGVRDVGSVLVKGVPALASVLGDDLDKAAALLRIAGDVVSSRRE